MEIFEPPKKGPGRPRGVKRLNSRQEAFARAVAAGKTQSEAARIAGYNDHGSNASRLASLNAIQLRINQLRAQQHILIEEKLAHNAKARETRVDPDIPDLKYYIEELKKNNPVSDLQNTMTDMQNAVSDPVDAAMEGASQMPPESSAGMSWAAPRSPTDWSLSRTKSRIMASLRLVCSRI